MPDQPLNLDAIDLSNEKLKRLAGSGAFQRGFDYYQQDPHLVYEVNSSKVTANVSGTRDYQQILNFSIQGLDGYCSCPASDNIDFCKHCVVVALAVRENQNVDPLASKAAKQPRVSARQKELDLIKNFIEKLDRNEVEASLLSLINEDKTHFTQWALRAHNALNPADAKFLKKKITQAFAINKHLHRYSQVSQYFAQAEPIVDLLMEQREGLSADALFSLADYALNRLGKALATIDDSGGYRFHCQDTLSQLFIEAVAAKQFSQQQLVALLLERFKQKNDIAPDIPDSYQELLGDEGLDTFYQALLTLWRAVPVPTSSDAWDEDGDYHHFFYELLKYARATNNVALLIDLQQRNARSASDLANLAELLIESKQWDQVAIALKQANKSNDAHYVAGQLLSIEVKLLVHQNEHAQAYLLIEYAFSVKPSFALYKQLHKFSELYGPTFDFQISSPELLLNSPELQENGPERRENNNEQPIKNPTQFKQISFDSQAILDQLTQRQIQDSLSQFTYSRLILDILFYHQRYADILKIDAQDLLPKEYLSRLIDAYSDSPDITLALYEKLVASYVGFSDNEHYRQAISALITAKKACLTAQSQSEFSALLARLVITYKAKRNFIQYLTEAGL
ncbi:MAG: hypothetical protein V7784_06495 [Oceanospirillaceae bacterium]